MHISFSLVGRKWTHVISCYEGSTFTIEGLPTSAHLLPTQTIPMQRECVSNFVMVSTNNFYNTLKTLKKVNHWVGNGMWPFNHSIIMLSVQGAALHAAACDGCVKQPNTAQHNKASHCTSETCGFCFSLSLLLLQLLLLTQLCKLVTILESFLWEWQPKVVSNIRYAVFPAGWYIAPILPSTAVKLVNVF